MATTENIITIHDAREAGENMVGNRVRFIHRTPNSPPLTISGVITHIGTRLFSVFVDATQSYETYAYAHVVHHRLVVITEEQNPHNNDEYWGKTWF